MWVGFDDERPIKLTGAQAALPIWSELAVRLIPRDPQDFEMPVGVVQRRVDPRSGQLATSQCPEKTFEFFITGTEPTVYCEVHGGGFWERLKADVWFAAIKQVEASTESAGFHKLLGVSPVLR